MLCFAAPAGAGRGRPDDGLGGAGTGGWLGFPSFQSAAGVACAGGMCSGLCCCTSSRNEEAAGQRAHVGPRLLQWDWCIGRAGRLRRIRARTCCRFPLSFACKWHGKWHRTHSSTHTYMLLVGACQRRQPANAVEGWRHFAGWLAGRHTIAQWRPAQHTPHRDPLQQRPIWGACAAARGRGRAAGCGGRAIVRHAA